MKQTFTLIGLWLTLALALVPSAQAQFLPGQNPTDSQNTQVIDRIVAIADGQVILQSALDQAVDSVKQQYASDPQKLPPPNVLNRQVLNRLILMRLQVEHAQQQGIRVSSQDVSTAISNIAANNQMTSAQLRAAVEQRGGSVAAFETNVAEQIMVQKLRDQVVKQGVHVTSAEVQNLVSDPTFNSAQVHLAHIEIDIPSGASPDDIAAAKARADAAEKAVAGGMDFSTAAIRFSQAPDALKGGDLGWRDASEIPPAFAQVVVNMKPGEVTKPLRGPSAFHILKLIARRTHSRNIVTQYHARQILIQPSTLVSDAQAQQNAENLYQQLIKNPSAFAKLAKADSDDDTSANLGGDMGWFQVDAHGPTIAKVLTSLKDGEVSKPFHTPQGWDIVQRLATRQRDVTDQMREQHARQVISSRKAEQVYEDFLRKLRATSYVKVLIPALRSPSQGQSQS